MVAKEMLIAEIEESMPNFAWLRHLSVLFDGVGVPDPKSLPDELDEHYNETTEYGI